MHLIKLLSLASHEEVVCHTAGVLRNLAAENQTKVCGEEGREGGEGRGRGRRVSQGLIISLPQAIINAGCLDALTNLVSESTNISGPMLNEVSAALAVIASDCMFSFGRLSIMILLFPSPG